MPKKKTQLDRFFDLSWNDIEEWAGGRIVSRGKSYQRQGRVDDLVVTNDGGLIAWVDGSDRYATKVVMDDDGLLNSICTCPYKLDCKHGVAVVIEYLNRVENSRDVPKVKKDDDRLELLSDEEWDDELNGDEDPMPDDMQQDIGSFLKGKSKAQLINMIHDLAGEYPEIAQNIVDRRQLSSGNVKELVKRLRKEIRDIGGEPGWQNYWDGEGFTPDYSGICKKLETLLKAEHADEVLALGRELVTTGIRQVEMSHDEGETAMEIAECMPVIVKALDKSSLDVADKLNWALDVVLEDQFDICGVFRESLHQRYPELAWNTLADRLLARLKSPGSPKGVEDFSRDYQRDRLSDWAIHAMEQAGRENEIIPLCIAEAKRTGSYDRLVKYLLEVRRYEDAEYWIHKGIRATNKKLPGIAAGLRDKLREIRIFENNWPAVAAMQVEEFLHRPSRLAFTKCEEVCGKAKVWSKVREHLLLYLEKGGLPWEQADWPLPESGLERPDKGQRNQFPLLGDLIDIAILEKKPDQVLKWYDQRPQERFGWNGADEDAIAAAVQVHAPDRAVSIWKKMAERMIDRVKPSAYQEAAKYLRKAAKIMRREKKLAEWEIYVKELRQQHARKRRLIEILDGLDGKPIVKRRV